MLEESISVWTHHERNKTPLNAIPATLVIKLNQILPLFHYLLIPLTSFKSSYNIHTVFLFWAAVRVLRAMLGSLKASFEQQRGADGPAFTEVLIVLIHRWLWCLSYLSISHSSRFLYPPQTHNLSVISVQPLSLSSSLSLKFEVRSGWKTFFTCCCCCCCLCPWATTPLAHNICVRLSSVLLPWSQSFVFTSISLSISL